MSPSRPQEPVPPFPYKVEEVSFENPLGGARLTGTLTVPSGNGPFPGALLISGSGQHDRDESIFGHKPFLVWADYLTRQGSAVLRWDDRGVGASTGDVRSATTADFASDVEAGVRFLRSRPEADAARIGLIGHSEGAMIASMVASRDTKIRFIVLIAGVGTTGEALLLEQKRLIEASEGIPPEETETSCQKLQTIFDAVKAAPDQGAAEAALHETWARIALESGEAPSTVPPAIAAIASPWMRSFLRYDPCVDLAEVRCSVLAVTGARDLQTPPISNLKEMSSALRANRDVTLIELPNLNHLLQTAPTGRLTEYEQIEETVSPAALSIVGSWIAARTNGTSRTV